MMFELGLIDEFLKLPHQKVETLTGQVGAERLALADFRHLPTHCKFIALTPQWDLLNFLAAQGRRYKTFDLRMQAEATDLVEENGRVAGVIARTPGGALAIRADLRSAATVAIRRCARRPASRATTMARRWTSYGFACHARPTTAPRHFGLSRRADDGHARSRRLLAVRL